MCIVNIKYKILFYAITKLLVLNPHKMNPRLALPHPLSQHMYQ